MKLRKVLNFSLILLTSNTLKAQTATIDYTQWWDLGCNAFSSNPSIQGAAHKTVTGQPIFSVSEGAIRLDGNWADMTNPTTTLYGTEYNFNNTFYFQPGHQIKVTVTCRQMSPMAATAYLSVQLTNVDGTNVTGCNGSAAISSTPLSFPNGATQGPCPNGYQDIVFPLSVNSTCNIVKIGTITGPYSPSTSVYIRKIKIEDITPTFTLTSSASSKACGTQLDNVTFTVANPGGVSVNGYKFYPQPGSYLYNGSPAPTEISTYSNSITLTALSCAGAAPVYAKVGWNGLDVQTNTKSFTTVTTPDLFIQGPDTRLVNEAGFYDVQGVTSTPINYNWPCSHFDGWSSSAPTQSTFYNTGSNPSPFTTYFYASSGALNTTVVITASVSMCGISKNISKGVRIIPPLKGGKISKSFTQNNEALSINTTPNPSKGIYQIAFNKFLSDANLTVTSFEGRIILSKKVSGLFSELDLTAFQSGIYILKVNDGENIETQKIIKE